VSCVEILRRRLLEWLSVVKTVDEYSRVLRTRLGRVSIILHGSFARGDFNVWSDVDLIIVSEKFYGIRVLDRYDLLNPTPPRVEPIPLTPEEFEANLEKPVWRHALNRGSIIFVDDYNLSTAMNRHGIRFATREQLVEKINSMIEAVSRMMQSSQRFF